MKTKLIPVRVVIFCLLPLLFSSCATYNSSAGNDNSGYTMAPKTDHTKAPSKPKVDYAARLPSHISTSEKTILVDPNVHAWGAYDAQGKLVRAGIATAGANYCPDVKRACRTEIGTFRINSLGSASCKSTLYPIPNGGAPMPYCMFFNGNQGLHGSYNAVESNVSHGCIRMYIPDAKWLRFNFADIGTKVIVMPY